MMLAHGEHNGKRILSKASVAKMTENQLTPELRATDHAKFVLGNTAGWGLGGSVELGNSPLGFPAGAFGWNGGYRHNGLH